MSQFINWQMRAGVLILLWIALSSFAVPNTRAALITRAATTPSTIYLPLVLRAGPAPVYAQALLGSIITISLPVSNPAASLSVAQLRESWSAPATPEALAGPTASRRVSLPNTPGPITPNAFAQLAVGEADLLIYLSDQADLSAAASIADWQVRGAAVVEVLRTHATRTQAALLTELHAQGYAPRSFWIVNAIAVRGDAVLARRLANRAEVALIDANQQHPLDPPTPQALAATANWGLDRINALAAWENWGARGAGIVVANIDTGVMLTHTALFTHYRGWSENGISNAYNWFDPALENPALEPNDTQGHGTHTMGTMLGEAIGVAPAAQWVAARGCGGYACSDTDLIASAQWMLAPTDLNGQNPRPDLRPHIINNSWAKLGEDPWYVGYVEAWNAAGIFSAFANGNAGLSDGCHSSSAPGNYANAFSVGATDADDVIAVFSSRGYTSDGTLKPNLSAPGVAVPSASLDGGYVALSGTSMAAPHVAGVVALLWSANPTLIGDLPATHALLTGSAQPLYSSECGDAPNARPNAVYGWGRVDARAAVEAARVDVPWLIVPEAITATAQAITTATLTLDARQVSAPGTYTAWVVINLHSTLTFVPVVFEVLPAPDMAQLTGQLHDRWTGAPLFGKVAVDDGPNAFTDANGGYTLTLPFGAYTLTANASGYASGWAALTLITNSVQPLTLTLNAPHIEWVTPSLSATLPYAASITATALITNAGPQTLTVNATVPVWEWSLHEVLTPTGLYDLSAFPPLPLADDMIYTNSLALGFPFPIYGVLTDHVYLSSNGWVTAYKTSSPASWARCLPAGSLPRATLAPFWADLDPSQGGAVRAGAVTSATFVVSFEAVPLWQSSPSPASPTYTFQLALHADGRAEFLYGPMAGAPSKWGVGVSWDETRGQNMACVSAPQTLAGRQWELRNQPSPVQWLSAAPNNLTLAPGESAFITATLASFGYVPWRTAPYEAIIRLTTNDPRQPRVDWPAQLLTTAPPFNMWMPAVLK